MRGDRAAATALSDRALRRVAQLGFPCGPFTTGYVKAQLVVIARLEGDDDAATRLADEMVELGDRHGFVLWTLVGSMHRLLSDVRGGGGDAALGALVDTFGHWRRMLSIVVYTPLPRSSGSWSSRLASVVGA